MIDNSDKVDYASALEHDLPAIASIHIKSLGVGLLSNCGSEFLIRMYRSIQEKSSNSIVVAKTDGRVVGFIVALVEEVSPFKSLSLLAVLIFLLNCFRKPYLFFSAVTVFRNLRRDSDHPGDVEISHFAVDDRYRDRSIGSRLIAIVEGKVLNSGLNSIFTRTHNSRLIEFYKTNFNASEVSRFSTSKIDYVTLKWLIDADRG